MRHFRRALPITIGLAAMTASVLLACGDDDTAVTPAPDSGALDANRSDTSTPTDSGGSDGGVDSGSDTGVDTGVDAGPTLTSAVGATGQIYIANDVVIGEFFEDDVILRWSNAPNCVVYVRGLTKPQSNAGTLTVGGQIVGTDGGTDAVINVEFDPSMGYFYPATVFAPVDTHTLTVEVAGAGGLAALPVQTMRPPREAPVNVTAPAVPDAGASLNIPSTAPLAFTWTPPVGGFVNEQKMAVRLQTQLTSAANSKLTKLYCAFPLSAGTATIPANVLAELKTRAGGTADAVLHAFAGSAKEVTTATGSYFIEVVRADTTPIAEINAKLQ